jgi:multidrug efflux system outer membrane protein
MPASWSGEGPWRAAQPADTQAKGSWWERFGDAELNALAQQAMTGNQTLAGAYARLTQARATLGINAASTMPQASLGVRAQRLEISANRPLTNYAAPNWQTLQNDYSPTLAVSYEIDLAGRVKSLVDGATASAQQARADLENTRLILVADLAVNYFSLRALDTELDVLTRSIGLQRSSLDLANHRHDLGVASGLDVAQQQALLDTTLTQVDILKRQRALLEHAIATLVGTPAPQFALPAKATPMTPPAIPVGIPSDVLQRRPDVAAAERAMAAANAQIGVATAAFYPSLIFGANGGFDSRDFGAVFNGPSSLWSLGVTATQTLFDGGRIQSNVDFTRAGYELAVANYRRVVLTAMQEVEDGISSVSAIDRAFNQAQKAIESNRRVLQIAQDRYQGGIANSQDVIIAQQSQLNSERLAAQLLGQRLLTSVFLIKALGGDWQMASASSAP